MTNERPANSANGQTLSPSEKLRFLPKNFVSLADMNNGMTKPIMAWKMDTCPPMLNTNSDMFNPSESRKEFTTGWFSRLVLTPTSIGVPTAPYDTGVDCSINAIMTAASAGKPRAMSSGPITVAGAPHPAAPSRNVPNSHATMIACTRLSGEMLVKDTRIVATAQLSLSTLSSRTAPKTMTPTSSAVSTPLKEAAVISTAPICQPKNAMSMVMMKL